MQAEGTRDGVTGEPHSAAEDAKLRRWERFRFGPHEIEVPSDWGVGIGGSTWGCSKPLGAFLANESLFPEGLRGKRVLELGSGTGVVGVAISLLEPARVVLTDDDKHQALMEETVRRNGRSGQVVVRELNWLHEDVPAAVEAEGPFDVVIGSDITYSLRLNPALAATIARVAAARTKVVIGHEVRLPGERAFFDAMGSHGFVWHRVPDWMTDAATAGSEQGIFVFTRRAEGPEGPAAPERV